MGDISVKDQSISESDPFVPVNQCLTVVPLDQIA